MCVGRQVGLCEVATDVIVDRRSSKKRVHGCGVGMNCFASTKHVVMSMSWCMLAWWWRETVCGDRGGVGCL
jgi:hypothetical protein